MKKILLAIAALFVAAGSFAQTGDPDWTKTGLAMPYATWTGFIDTCYVGTPFTVQGWEEEKTIKITDAYGTTLTITNDDEEYITNMNGEVVTKGSYNYVNSYFQFGSIYYANFCPGYDSYSLCSEDEGYVLLSGYFYDEAAPSTYIWGYVYITWTDEGIGDTKEIKWSTYAQPRWSLEASSRSTNDKARATDHLTAGATTPKLVAYTDDSFKVFAFAGHPGYDLEFSLTSDSTLYLDDATYTECNSKGTRHNVPTGDAKYDRLGIYSNGSTTDYNEVKILGQSRGYINIPYAVGYMPEKPASGSYPYICYGLSWYNPYCSTTGNVTAQSWDEATSAYVDVDSILVEGTITRELYFFKSDSTYVIPQYRGEGSADLWFKMNADSTINVIALPFGSYFQSNGYTYDWGYDGQTYGDDGSGNPVNAWLYYETSIYNGYYYSKCTAPFTTDEYNYVVFADQGEVYFYAGAGVGSNNPSKYFFYTLSWGESEPVVETELWTVVGAHAIMNGDTDWNQAESANDMTSTDGVTYTLTVENKTLEAGVKYEYKICKDHAWDTAYPANNASITVDETAIYTIVYTYNAETNDVSAVATKTGEAGEITHTYSIAGNPASVFGASWDQTATATTMTETEDANVLSWTSAAVTFDAETKVEFKVVEDYAWGVAYPASNYVLTVPAGTYTITVTFNKNTKEVGASYNAATGINAVSTAVEAPVYNAIGVQVSKAQKGLYIQNGKKYMVK